jgi:hypothetical protein
MFIDNSWWGHKYVFAKYCKVDLKPIFGSFQHGVYTLEYEKNWKLQRSFQQIPFFCNSTFFYRKCIKQGEKNVIAIGSPFLYLKKIYNKKKKERGTLVFISHSGFKVKKFGLIKKYFKDNIQFDHEGFINNVEQYNNPPYVVSIIKDDYKLISQFYKRKNWKIFSAGNRYDKLFLINIYKLISKYKYAVFSEFTSALYYSMFLGLKVRIAVKSLSSKKIQVYNKIPKDEMLNFKSYKKKYPQIFFGGLNINLAKNIAKERMGYDNIKTKEELKKLFGWNSYIKFFFSKLFLIIYNIKYQFKKNT